jgi:hypothetical protein
MPLLRCLSRGRRSFVASLVFVAIASCSGEPVEREPIGSIEQAVCDGTTAGDWSGFPLGDGTSNKFQCVHGVGVFYTTRFAVPRLAASNPTNNGNCQALGACNLWVTPANHPSPTYWNRYAWGTEPVQTYDLVVYPPPTTALGFGHVASVDHVSGGTLYVMDMNWNSAPDSFKYRKATCAHTIARTPYGFYRLKSLEPAKPPPTSTDAGSDADAQAPDSAIVISDGAVADSGSRDIGPTPDDPDTGDATVPLDVQGSSCSAARLATSDGEGAVALVLAVAGVLVLRRRIAHGSNVTPQSTMSTV